jgi:molybdenum cofactor sulfurtransferase
MFKSPLSYLFAKMDRCSGRLTFDREFALVYTSGTAMRLHSHPKMSQIHPMIDLQSNIMTVRAPNHDDLILSLEDTGSTMSSQDVEVCGTLCKGCVFGGCMASKWFSSVLGVRCWLVRHQDKVKTERNSQDTTWGHAYSNDAPLLVVSQQSISYLNKVITTQGWGKPVEARHFRPNIVVSGVDYDSLSHPEDSWEQIIIRGNNGTVILNAVGKCARCQMVDVDPSSGMKGNTLRALAQYRRDQGRINFGKFFIGVSDAYVGDMNFWMIEEGDIVDASSKNKIDCIM